MVAVLAGSARVPRPKANMETAQNGWGALANQKVTFKVEETGASCTALTNSDGASCAVRPPGAV
jgi:hypothetical protein